MEEFNVRVDINTTSQPDVSSEECASDEKPVVFGYEDPSKNLLKNWSFDEPISSNDWMVVNADVTRSPDAHTGKWSLHVHSRKHKHGQAYQRVYDLKPGTQYYYSFFIKFLSHPPEQMYFDAKVFVKIKFPNEVRKQNEKVCWLKFQKAPCDWQQLGGNFRTPDTPFEYIETHMDIDPEDIDFLLDTTSLIELPEDPDWRESCDRLIDQHRKSDVTVDIKLPPEVKPKDFSIQITQKKREFGFGSAISADPFNAPEGQKYRDCFFQHFEWAVFCNDTKWRPMEPRKGQIRFERVDKALEKLHEKGITVRGHAIHWNREKNCPDWIHGMEGEKLQAEIDRRTQYVVEHFKGRLVQWDVCNEYLHNHFYEEKTGNHNQLAEIFTRAHEIDPDCHLYLNDYLVIRGGGMLTSGQANLARQLLASGVPVHGIGVQSHLKTVPVPIELLRKRVEIVSSAGLPIMVTEFSSHSDDVSVRARGLEEALSVYFSSPSVKGVVFWHFSDQKGMSLSEDMALFEGPDFVPNEAGRMLQKLLTKWRTNLTIKPPKRKFQETYRAFHGKYEVQVHYRGVPISSQSFTVEKCRRLNLKVKVTTEKLGDNTYVCAGACADTDSICQQTTQLSM